MCELPVFWKGWINHQARYGFLPHRVENMQMNTTCSNDANQKQVINFKTS